MARLSSWKENPPILRIMLAIRWLAASESGCPSDHAGESSAVFSTPRKPLASSRSRTAPEVGERVQRVADHEPHAGEGRVEPVDRRLALLEVVQVDPAPRDAVDADHGARRAPVGLLDARLVEDHALQAADDVAGALERQLRRPVEVDRVAALRDLGQQTPVVLADRDHVVDARVVAVAHLGQAEVGALAGVARARCRRSPCPRTRAAVAHRRRNSSSVPNSGSTDMLMRSKWPSTRRREPAPVRDRRPA